MEPREQRGGMRDDNTSTGGQWDDPMSKSGQGKWEQRGDDTSGQGGDAYTQQRSAQSGYEYGTNVGGGGQTGTTTGLGGTDTTQSDRSKTSGQYSGQERFPTGQSQFAGYTDPTRGAAGAGGGRQPEDDDDYGASVGPGGGPTGKPSMTSRVKGAAEQMTGKITGDQGKQARGREREEGNL